MASKNVDAKRSESKSGLPPTVHAPSKLLEECGRCGRPVFQAKGPRARIAVEVLEHRRGNVALQTTFMSDELVATHSGMATYYRRHVCRGAFSRAIRAKVRL